ncbi:GNAT family N-acetyltransferase [Salinisphaera hydrothermalis]|uniref:GNAT family N-acetyltransferase n=1 Tax=Salinisphaera hydrothermalis TaxID=563188 RepID=UPI00333E3C1F
MSRASAVGELVIEAADLDAPDIRALVAEHWQAMADASPGESMHGLDIAALRDPAIRVRSARINGELAGIAALVDLGAGHAELKSMRTARGYGRRGVAGRLLNSLLAEARAAGFARVSLETGTESYYDAARAFYRRHGFIECAPFADYQPDPASIFMTRALHDDGAPNECNQQPSAAE